MKVSRYLLLLLIFASCNSFQNMRYRHIRKVPATPQLFPVNAEKKEQQLQETTHSEIRDSSYSPEINSAIINELPADTTNQEPEKVSGEMPQNVSANKVLTRRQIRIPAIRHDFSLLIASMMIFAGVLLVFYCIYVVPAANIFLLIRIAMELLLIFAAWKLISNGIMIFYSRFRSRTSFKET